MQNIGERLEEARKRKGISIREAAEATKVRGDYLHRFESSQFDINLPDIYVRGFLRAYASYLGLPGDKIVADYNALGHGRPKTKSSSREIYGRMDIAPPPEKNPPRDSGDENASGESSPRGATSPGLPARAGGGLPALDRDLLIKAGIGAGIVVIVVVLVIGIVNLTRSETDATTAEPATPGTSGPAAGRTIAGENVAIIHALDTVRVKVVHEVSGEELYQGTIVRGDSRPIPWEGDLLVTASAMENIEIEMDGVRHPTLETGHKRIRVLGPAAMRGNP